LFINKSGLACCLYCIKWLALYWSFFTSGVSVKLAQSSSQWEARPIQEMSQTLLTNKKQGNLDYFLSFKIMGAPKKLKNCPLSLFISNHQKPNPSRETALKAAS
jgi:hypothetical protein